VAGTESRRRPWLWATILTGAAFLGGGAHNSRNNGHLQQVNDRRKPTRARTSSAYMLTLSASIGVREIGGTVARDVVGAAVGSGGAGGRSWRSRTNVTTSRRVNGQEGFLII
jgi:hypothetical protein